jgi:hypothetical protein
MGCTPDSLTTRAGASKQRNLGEVEEERQSNGASRHRGDRETDDRWRCKPTSKPGQKVFVKVGSGGVGTFAIQYAKALGA